MNYQNIFESDFSLPKKVCILAPGPNGKAHYAEIPRDFCLIAVANAVLIPEVGPDIWMMNHADQEWYERAESSFEGICIFGDAAMKIRPELPGKKVCYYFEPPVEPLNRDMSASIEGVIRIGGSIVGCALQLGYNFGAKEILLCGVDMSGDGYWNGTANTQVKHGETWSTVERLNPLIRWLWERKGISVYTLSPTKLNVRRFVHKQISAEDETPIQRFA